MIDEVSGVPKNPDHTPFLSDVGRAFDFKRRTIFLAASVRRQRFRSSRDLNKLPMVTPQSLGGSIAWRADRRRDPTPVNIRRLVRAIPAPDYSARSAYRRWLRRQHKVKDGAARHIGACR